MPTLIEERQKLEAKQKELKAKFDSYPLKDMADGTKARDIPANDLEGINTLHDEINEIGKSVESLRKAAEAEEELKNEKKRKETPVNKKGIGNAPPAPFEAPSVKLFDAEQFKSRGRRSMVDTEIKLFDSVAEFKTLMTTTANGYPPEVLRDGTVVPLASRPPQLIDYLMIEPTESSAIKFMKQTVRTNNAAAASEGSAVGEAAITYAESTDIISRIGVHVPVTEEELEDEPTLRTLIDNDLILMTKQVLDENVTVGDGSAPNLRGIFNASSIQSQAKGTDPTFDAIMKAITKVNVTGRANSNLIALHSNDWQEIVLTRTADGLYILGNPGNMPDKRLWGLPVVMSEALTEGNGLVLDTFYFRVKLRKSVSIAITDSHDEDFTKNILRIRAHVRAGLKKMRDQAACKVTGI